MNCKNCGKELNEGAKFCPECGAKVGEVKKVEKNKEEVVVVTNSKASILSSLSLLMIYTGAGVALVSMFFEARGFGLFKDRDINQATVWISFGVSLLVALVGTALYFSRCPNCEKLFAFTNLDKKPKQKGIKAWFKAKFGATTCKYCKHKKEVKKVNKK